MRRRALLLAPLTGLAACAGEPVMDTAPRAAGFATPWRTVMGGFLAPALPTAAMPGAMPRPGSDAFVHLQSPGAIALRGQELLVADLASGRLWRADLGFNTLTPLAGATASPLTALMFGTDLSAWVLDAASRQVLRFGRDGRLLQTWRTGAAAVSPTAIALADGGATLLVADPGLAQWAELRSGGALAQSVLPRRPDGARLLGVDALAVAGEQVVVLDRAAAAVHRVARDGRVLESLPWPAGLQAGALAADRFGRIFLLDAGGRSIGLLQAGREARVLDAAALGAQQIGGLAIDERHLAVSDRLTGQVLIVTLAAESAP